MNIKRLKINDVQRTLHFEKFFHAISSQVNKLLFIII